MALLCHSVKFPDHSVNIQLIEWQRFILWVFQIPILNTHHHIKFLKMSKSQTHKLRNVLFVIFSPYSNYPIFSNYCPKIPFFLVFFLSAPFLHYIPHYYVLLIYKFLMVSPTRMYFCFVYPFNILFSEVHTV